MKKTWTPLLWFRFEDKQGCLWSVLFTARDVSPEFYEFEELTGNSAAGFTQEKSHTVLVDAGSEVWDQEDTLLHEVFHVVLCGTPISIEVEEELVSLLTPRALPVLKRWGLRFPKRPKGYVALARHARRINEDK